MAKPLSLREQVQAVWFVEHEMWWFDPPKRMQIGDIGTIERGKWHKYRRDDRPELDAVEREKEQHGSRIRYTTRTLKRQSGGDGKTSWLTMLLTAGVPVTVLGRAARKKRAEVGAVVSAESTEQWEARDFHGLIESMQRHAKGFRSWDPEWKVVTSMEVATSAQHRALLHGRNSSVTFGVSAEAPGLLSEFLSDAGLDADGSLEGVHALAVQSGSASIENEGYPIQVGFHHVDPKWKKWRPGLSPVDIAEPVGTKQERRTSHRTTLRRLVPMHYAWAVTEEELQRLVNEGTPIFVPFTWDHYVAEQTHLRRAAALALMTTAAASALAWRLGQGHSDGKMDV